MLLVIRPRLKYLEWKFRDVWTTEVSIVTYYCIYEST